MHCPVLNCKRDPTDRLTRNTSAGSYVLTIVCPYHRQRIESEPEHWSFVQKLDSAPTLVRDVVFVR